jgi:Fe-S-cluster containining protein
MDRLRGGRIEDGDLLGFMLRELTHEHAVERQEQFNAYGGAAAHELDPTRTYYRCIYWNEETHLCGAYDNRPLMCAEYPYPWKPIDDQCSGQGSAGVCEHGCDCQGAPLLWEGD